MITQLCFAPMTSWLLVWHLGVVEPIPDTACYAQRFMCEVAASAAQKAFLATGAPPSWRAECIEQPPKGGAKG